MIEINADEKRIILLNIIETIDEVCKKNGLTYFAAYGTLLGAIRHKGFIPWDDDADIWVPIEDYEKFIEIMKNYSDYQVISNIDDHNWMDPFAKISDKRTIIVDNNKNLGWNNIDVTQRGVSVDIFPLFSCDDHSCDYLLKLWKWRMRQFKNKRNGVRRIKHYLCNIFDLIGLDEKCCDKKMYDYEMKDKCTEWVGCPISPYGKKDRYRKQWFHGRKYVDFMGGIVVPNGYDEILKSIYGDYMTPPPECERNKPYHNVKAYWL